MLELSDQPLDKNTLNMRDMRLIYIIYVHMIQEEMHWRLKYIILSEICQGHKQGLYIYIPVIMLRM